MVSASAVIVWEEERMEAALRLESPAVGVRERLAGFVGEVTAPLPLRRQRENALLYVRGLVEQGGRKSLQPTLFRLEESPARYVTVQSSAEAAAVPRGGVG
jgi:hypothetical protein